MKKITFVIEKIKKYRKCPALQSLHKYLSYTLVLNLTLRLIIVLWEPHKFANNKLIRSH